MKTDAERMDDLKAQILALLDVTEEALNDELVDRQFMLETLIEDIRRALWSA